jgi:hypothetical protein
MNSNRACSTVWTERYEVLRRYVLEGRQRLQTQPLGLALWLAKGMAGWMKQWTELIEVRSLSPRPVFSTPVASGGWQEQLTLLLAQMTLEQLQPRSCYECRI